MARSTRARCRTTGFSLVELLITLAVLATVLAVSAPAWQDFAARQALVSATNSLVTGLQLARNHAITSRTPVLLCPADEHGGCGGRAAWSQGWLVQPEHRDAPATGYRGQLPDGMSVSLNQGRQHVRFLPDGRSPGTNLTFQMCSRQRTGRQVIINNSGRVRSGPINHAPC